MTILVIILASICNAIMDVVSFKYDISVFKNNNFFNPLYSWINKWKVTSNGLIIVNNRSYWYYLWLYKPEFKERFPYSSTLFVRFTDGWHLFKSLNYMLLFVGLMLYEVELNLFLDFILLYTIYTFTFEIFYRYVFRDS